MSIGEDRMDERPVSGLLTDLVSQITALFRTEINLLKAEMRDNVRSFSGALVSIAIGAALLIAAVIVLVQAVVAALVDMGLSVWLASLIVGAVLGIVGAIMIKSGTGKMKPSELAPDRTARQMEKDVALMKETSR